MTRTRNAGRAGNTTGANGTGRENPDASPILPRPASQQQTYRSPKLDQRTLLEVWQDSETHWRQKLANAHAGDPRRETYAYQLAMAERNVAKLSVEAVR